MSEPGTTPASDGPDVPSAGLLGAVFGGRVEAACSYAELLATRGVEWGVVGPREVGRIWSRHVLNSVAVAPLIQDGATVVDVGSGAGLPGIPVALARPDLAVSLLEPLERRAEFLTLAVAELGLSDRVEVVRGRAEEQRGRTWAVVTCRAVAPLGRLVTWTGPLFVPHGELLAIKGESAPTEVARAAKELSHRRLQAEVLIVRAHPESEPTRVIRVAARRAV